MTSVPAGAGRRCAVLALGSNLGDRLQNLRGAVDALLRAPGLGFIAISPVYQSEAAGGPPQPRYLNAVLIVETAQPAREILGLAQGIEKAFHRTREERWAPRTLDIDIVTCGAEISDDPELTLPHPRAHERAFVLVPWLDADPRAELPGRGRVADLLRDVPAAGLRRCGDAVIRSQERDT